MMSAQTTELPPKPPPLPPSRTGLLQRITAPFNLGTRAPGSQLPPSGGADAQDLGTGNVYKSPSSQTTVHRTGIPIAALDVNRERTHVILAGQEILKTVRIQHGKAVEDFNLRSAVNSSAAFGPKPDAANHRREYLPTKDVRWSHGDRYDHIIATAALNGRIALYDVSRLSSSRVELQWIHHHTGQVNKLDFDPFGGYLLLSGSQDKTVKLWDIRDPKSVLKKQNFNTRHPVRDVKWSPTDVGEFAVCTESGIVQRWDLRYPAQALLSINAHEKACYTIDWHADGRHVVSGGIDKYVRVWDFKSENRRQKPAFQLRTPQAVMNLQWRPPCWSSELTQSGLWQCTQLATGYTDDDPRVHVWDLRRPLVPFRELDRHNSRPTDLLWASKDSLWTVGNEGMFTQTDIRYAAQVHDELPPCALQFAPNGSLVTFTEDLAANRGTSQNDPAARFLSIPVERLSGGTDEVLSRTASDDDPDDDVSATSSRRVQSKARSSRQAKSQGSTPPTGDGLITVTSLDEAISGRKDLFNNEQTGTLSTIEGVAAAPHVIEFLAHHYTRPLLVQERKLDPGGILRKIEEAFMRNADVCDSVSWHRTAQSWRILCAVVVPELQDWADKNRRERLELEAKRVLPDTPLSLNEHGRHFQAHVSPRKGHPKSTERTHKVASNLFRGVIASEGLKYEMESSSSVTTPLAVPLPDSPRARSAGEDHNSLPHIHENLPPLPPSVLNSHVPTAAYAAGLGFDSPDQVESPPTSPRSPKPASSYHAPHRRVTESSGPLPANGTDERSASAQLSAKVSLQSSTHNASPKGLRTQEDRRAAIRDYRAHARPLFTLDAPVQSPRYDSASRHDSADSFPMFSASTESSSKLQSLTDSYASSNAMARDRTDSEDWQHIQERESLDSTPPSRSTDQSQRLQYRRAGREARQDSTDFAVDDAPGFSFGADGKSTLNPPIKQKISSAANIWQIPDTEPQKASQAPGTTASSASDGMFHFEQVAAAPKLRIYSSNPIRRMASQVETVTLRKLKEQDLDIKIDDLPSEQYVYSDFRPVNFTEYEPRLPFAWSALPLICHTIAFDITEGPACALFAVHLLMHLHPFFFNQAFREPLPTSVSAPDGLAERLMRPDLSHRIIEGLFTTHVQFLHRARLFAPMAQLKNICVEFDYPSVFKPSQHDAGIGASLPQDPYGLQISCTECHNMLSGDTTSCPHCKKVRDLCPICLTWDPPPAGRPIPLHAARKLWTFCPMCGHGAHFSCMGDWFLSPHAEGECPSLGCGCDCGPGIRRQQRITRQVADTINSEITRGSRTSSSVTRRDPVRATPSPAVDKARDTLRYADLTDRSMQSGNGIDRRSFSGQSGQSGQGGRSGGSRSGSTGRESLGGRRVRLVTPGEQSGGEPRHPVI